ncbi:hypothetical protein [Phaeodactylibacter luteus]|uniref:Uncharacterized protein n=1 Tax=Phaeodactylibacter luteus TaxID=1564516 RepID=A0A5C6RP60_9BACT|nr:hypothetical protein [Phaeodactylibacter luteus]TXB64106.1 hypothetical protein FRY97_07370 [Phaeodactylibacter luteus]
MKQLIFTALLTLSAIMLHGQIYEGTAGMSAGTQNALIIDLPGVNDDIVNDVWKEYMKDFYNAKPKYQRRDREWLSDDADIAAIGKGNSVDIYAKAEQQDANTRFFMWVDLGGAFLNKSEHPEAYTEGEKLLMRFGLEVAKAKVRIELETQQDALKNLQRDLERLQSAKERYEREIQRAKETIAKAEKDIEQNLQDQEAMQEQIKAQEGVVEQVKRRLNDL